MSTLQKMLDDRRRQIKSEPEVKIEIKLDELKDEPVPPTKPAKKKK